MPSGQEALNWLSGGKFAINETSYFRAAQYARKIMLQSPFLRQNLKMWFLLVPTSIQYDFSQQHHNTYSVPHTVTPNTYSVYKLYEYIFGRNTQYHSMVRVRKDRDRPSCFLDELWWLGTDSLNSSEEGKTAEERNKRQEGKLLHLEKILTGSHPSVAKQLWSDRVDLVSMSVFNVHWFVVSRWGV